jgi:alpha-mannosidase
LTRIWEANGFSEDVADKQSLFALNTLLWKRTEILKLPHFTSGSEDPTPQYGIAEADGIGFTEVKPLPSTASATQLSVSIREVSPGVFILANDQLHLQVENGCITSLIDHSSDPPRSVIPEGAKANQFVIFDDKPLNWQAWDVEVYHLNSRQELPSGKTQLGESGPYRVSVVTETKISERSWAITTISLSPAITGQPSYVEFDCEVEWRESMIFLKVEFPVTVNNKEASYETQFGVTTRPTHYNTT